MLGNSPQMHNHTSCRHSVCCRKLHHNFPKLADELVVIFSDIFVFGSILARRGVVNKSEAFLREINQGNSVMTIFRGKNYENGNHGSYPGYSDKFRIQLDSKKRLRQLKITNTLLKKISVRVTVTSSWGASEPRAKPYLAKRKTRFSRVLTGTVRYTSLAHLSEVQFQNGSNDMRWSVRQICLVFTIFK